MREGYVEREEVLSFSGSTLDVEEHEVYDALQVVDERRCGFLHKKNITMERKILRTLQPKQSKVVEEKKQEYRPKSQMYGRKVKKLQLLDDEVEEQR